jgi:hypothetical protein
MDVYNSKYCDELLKVVCFDFRQVTYKLNSGVVKIPLPPCLLAPEVCNLWIKKIMPDFLVNENNN